MPPIDPETPILELHFQRPPFWSHTMLSLPLVGGLLVPRLYPVFLLLTVAARFFTRPKAVPPLLAYDDYMLLPKSADSKKAVRIHYQDILGLFDSQGKRGRLILSSRKHVVSYPLRAFLDADAVERLRAVIRERLLQKPGGAALLEQMEQRETLGRFAFRVKPLVTWVLTALIALCFALEYFSGALSQMFGLVRFGANAPVLVAEGQWFRVLTANFLHANLPHLLMNSAGLLIIGMVLERLAGPWRFLIIYLMGALGGAAASALLTTAPMSVGASTAIFGIMGALALLNWRFRDAFPAGFHLPARTWILIFGVNAALPLLIPQIDAAGHAGGLIAGALAAALLCQRPESVQLRHGAPRWQKWLSAGFAGVFVLGFAQAAVYALRPVEMDEIRVARVFLASPSIQPATLNEVAWRYVSDPASGPDKLALAITAAERALGLQPDLPEFLDTLATAYFRIGQIDRAIATERQAISMATKSQKFYFSQLGRFLDARLRASGPLEIGATGVTGLIRVSLAKRGQDLKPEAVIDFGPTATPRNMNFYALLKRKDELQGVLWAALGPGNTRIQLRMELPAIKDWGDDSRFEIALLDTTGCGCKAKDHQGFFTIMDPEVLKLP
jgi:rhomboid protease GluP